MANKYDYLQNPLFQMGAGILGAQGNIGRGIQSGLLGLGQQQRLQMAQQQQEQQRSMQQQQFDAQQQMRDLRMQQMRGQMGRAQSQRHAQTALFADNPQIGQIAQAYPGIAESMLKQKYAPTQPKLPTGMRAGVDGQWEYDPNYIAGQERLKTAGAIQVNTAKQRLPTDQEIKREDVLSRATGARKFNAGVLSQGHSAQKDIGNYERAIKLLEKVPTGPLEQSIMEGKRLAGRMGFSVDWDKIGSSEELRVLLGDQIMARVAETKGAVSEKEMDLFTQYSANYGNTPEGNRAILAWKKSKAKRDADLSRMVRRMQRANKSSMEIQEAVWSYVDQNDLSSYLGGGGQVDPATQDGWSIRRK